MSTTAASRWWNGEGARHDHVRRRSRRHRNQIRARRHHRGAAAAGGDDRRARLAARQSVVDAVQYRADDPDRAAARLGDPGAGQIPADRRGVDRQPTATPAAKSCSTARSAPAGRSSGSAGPISSTAPIRSRSAGASMCSSRCWRSAWCGCSGSKRRAATSAPVYFFVVLPICSFILLTGWSDDRTAAGRHRAVGRRAGHHRGGLGRHRALAAARHPAGARAALAHADGQAVFGDLHRIRARRAAGDRAVHGERDAAAVRARAARAGQIAARADRHRAVCLGLYGGGGARRLAGDPQGPVRGRHGGGPRLLADDAAHHPAAGAEDHHPEYRQHLYRTVQGHHAGVHRRDFRFPAHDRGRAHRSEMGDAGDQHHRLRGRRDVLSDLLLRHVALCPRDGSPARQGRADAKGGCDDRTTPRAT